MTVYLNSYANDPHKHAIKSRPETYTIEFEVTDTF